MSTQAEKKKDDKNLYKETLNLPQTAFSMEAKLVQNEPARLAKWQSMDLYKMLMRQRADGPTWELHDGPPFANGDIHIGHLINKTLKDVIQRFRSMQGYRTPYVPGWDCHGLPIEHKIQEELGPKLRQMAVVDVRKLCYEYAAKYVKLQSEQFQRLGILGEWDKPYATMTPDYEASTLEVFAKFVEAGLVYKKLKPVAWSVQNQTALADAELEYKDVTDPSVYVEFPLTQMQGAYLLVWTTTPWTLPANLSVAVGANVQYARVRYRREGHERIGGVAVDLVERVFKARAGVESYEVLDTPSGKDLVGQTYRHPFIDGLQGRIVAADYVTTTDGTGLVHTAPGHGEDDFETGIREGLKIYSPVLANGRFDETAPQWLQGKTVWEANPLITDELRKRGLLVAEEPVLHSYPHDWRSKKPIIFRATEQWFISVDKPCTVGGGEAKSLRQRALEVCDSGGFVPDWGRARLRGMLESRPDWCVSRQRAWGLPIPVFYNEKGEALLTPDSVRAAAERFAEKGSDAWFNESPAQLLGDFNPPPQFPKDKLRKEQDIFDVWFESGSSWNAVLRKRPYLQYPSDMYLEGSDQHRGWFQLSLLCALGATGVAPFKQVLTHGFSVKPDGTKVSKSDKEYVTVVQEVNRHGADLLRLWCCSVDYQNDMPTSPKVIQEFADKYRKIRNTLRYLLSNLYDYEPPAQETVAPIAGSSAPPAAVLASSSASPNEIDGVPLNSLDGWALAELDQLITDVTAAYDAYQLHRVFRLIYDFCAVQISAIYGNAMKDRLYCEAPDSPPRRRSQAVMHKMLTSLTKLLAPMIVFTADEVWEHIPHKAGADVDLPSVHLALLPKASGVEISADQREEWKLLMDLRDQGLGQLDALKKQVGLNKAIDAEIVYQVDDDAMRQKLQAYGVDLEDLVGAGHHTFAEKPPESPAVTVKVIDRRETYKACARSWKRRPDVGRDPEYPDLTLRDAAAVKAVKR